MFSKKGLPLCHTRDFNYLGYIKVDFVNDSKKKHQRLGLSRVKGGTVKSKNPKRRSINHLETRLSRPINYHQNFVEIVQNKRNKERKMDLVKENPCLRRNDGRKMKLDG